MPAIDVEFAMNPDPRCACVLLLDTSAPMAGEPIAAFNAGFKAFQEDLQKDALARRRVEIAVVTFGKGGVIKTQDFVIAAEFNAPTLEAEGSTPMGEAIHAAVEMVRERKSQYMKNGVAYYRPWIFMISNGTPDLSSPWKEAAAQVRSEMAANGLVFFAVGAKNADKHVLSQITPRALTLDGLRFRELFLWLSQSLRRASGSNSGEQDTLPEVNFGSPV